MQSEHELDGAKPKPAGSVLRALLLALLFGLFAAGMVLLRWANRPLPALVQPQVVLPPDNAYERWVAVLERIATLPSRSPVREPLKAPLEALREPVSAERADLDELRKVVRQPIVRPPGAYFRPVRGANEAALLLAAQSRWELAEGRAGEAMDTALDGVLHASVLGREVVCIFGIARVETACAAARECVPKLSAAEARFAGKRIEALCETLPTWADWVAQDRLESLLRARQVAASPKAFAKLLGLGDGEDAFSSARNRLVWTVYPKANGYAELAEWWDRLYADGKRPYHERQRTFFTRSILGRKIEPGVSSDVLPTLGLARLRLLRLELALREYRLARGRYPASLAELRRGVVSQMPVDPFNDEPFHYASDGRGYVLYSVGPNLFDEEGTPMKDELPGRTSAGDVVVTGRGR